MEIVDLDLDQKKKGKRFLKKCRLFSFIGLPSREEALAEQASVFLLKRPPELSTMALHHSEPLYFLGRSSISPFRAEKIQNYS